MANHIPPNIEDLADDLVILGNWCGVKHRTYKASLKCGARMTRKRTFGHWVSDLPPAIGLLTNLEELWVMGHESNVLPPEIGNHFLESHGGWVGIYRHTVRGLLAH